MKRQHSVTTCFISLVILALSAWVQAEDLNIVVTRGYDTKTKIAIVPFYWGGSQSLPEEVSDIVQNNLSRTGRFDTLPPRDMLSQPTSDDAVFYRDWRLLDQEYLVIGNIEPAGDSQVSVRFALFDVVKGQRVVAGSQTVGVYQLRDLAHSISDVIYERITGVRGIFSTKIGFVTRRGTTGNEFEYRLQVADADGQRARTVYRSNEPIISPAWSHTGKRIAFANKVGDRWKVFVQELASGKSTNISSQVGYTSSPSFSPDGRYLAYVSSAEGNPELYLYDFSNGRSTRLTRNSYIDTEPSFSPDSKSLVYTSERGGSPQIYKMDLASKRIERLTFEGSQNLKAQYSSDGQYLVFIHQYQGRFHVAAMDLATRNIRVLTETNLDESPSIAPNGTMLVYATQKRGKGVLAWVSLDGQVTSEMPSIHGDVIEPAWSPYLN
ncbi:Tol-Pal system beta propeller repeat protein TolB [Saccharospirillum salsuginis]|uniref:Tol-Pal system protein TolB n=1 Tax=Saccharospirillum salsuginis TaxID=418750 RepID=A0A918NEZ7_9GAMM|nr:Tol-Pal system beta propeller repeat protein TolB [Saccharospirillum salsuginis]GGX62238.1 protein TolB [Saccharospirillum salsuginis]